MVRVEKIKYYEDLIGEHQSRGLAQLPYRTAHEWVNADRLEVFRQAANDSVGGSRVGEFLRGVDNRSIVVDYSVSEKQAVNVFKGKGGEKTREEYEAQIESDKKLLEAHSEALLSNRPEWAKEAKIDSVGDLLEFLSIPEKVAEIGFRNVGVYKLEVIQQMAERSSGGFVKFYNSLCNDFRDLPENFWHEFKEVQPIDNYKRIGYEEIEKFKKSDYYRTMMVRHLMNVLELYPNGLSVRELKEKVNVNLSTDGELFRGILAEQIKRKKIMQIAAGEYVVKRSYRCIEGAVGGEDSRTIRIVRMRIEGNRTLQEVGEEFDITRERVRQIEAKYMKAARNIMGPRLHEEKFRYLVNNYRFEVGEFQEVFPWECYLPVVVEGAKKDLPLKDAIGDLKVPYYQRRRISEYLVRNYQEVDSFMLGEDRVPTNKAELYRHIMKKYASESSTPREILDRLGEDNIDTLIKRGITSVSGERLFITTMTRQIFVINTFGQKIRYYDFEAYDYKELLENLDYKKVGCTFSVECWFKKHSKLMEKYDIRDHYELHSLLRRLWETNEEIEMMRSPVVHVVGGKTEEEIMMDIIKEHRIIKRTELAQIVWKKFCLRAANIENKYPNTFFKRVTLSGNVYSEEKVFTPEQLRILKRKIGKKESISYVDLVRIAGEVTGNRTIDISYFQVKQLGISVVLNGRMAIENNYGGVEFDPIKGEYIEGERFVPKARKEREATKEVVNVETEVEAKVKVEEAPKTPVKRTPMKVRTPKKEKPWYGKNGVTEEVFNSFIESVRDISTGLAYFNTKNLKDMGFHHAIYEKELGNNWYDRAMRECKELIESGYEGITLFKNKNNVGLSDFVSEINKELSFVGLDMIHRKAYINRKYRG